MLQHSLVGLRQLKHISILHMTSLKVMTHAPIGGAEIEGVLISSTGTARCCWLRLHSVDNDLFLAEDRYMEELIEFFAPRTP